MRDIDAAIDLHSGEAQEWEHKLNIADGCWAWTHGALGVGDCSDIAVVSILCFLCGLRVGSISEWFDWSQVVASLTAPTVKRLPRVLRGLARSKPLARRYLQGIEARSFAGVRASGAQATNRERGRERERERESQGRSCRRCSDRRGGHHRGVEASLSLLSAGCSDDVGVEHFSIVKRGGAWTAAHLDTDVDGVRASASTAHAK